MTAGEGLLATTTTGVCDVTASCGGHVRDAPAGASPWGITARFAGVQ